MTSSEHVPSFSEAFRFWPKLGFITFCGRADSRDDFRVVSSRLPRERYTFLRSQKTVLLATHHELQIGFFRFNPMSIKKEFAFFVMFVYRCNNHYKV